MKILVPGGGAMGRVIAADLARGFPTASIDVADIRRPDLPERANLPWREGDCSTPESVAGVLSEYDFGFGAVPSRFGFGVLRGAIEARIPLVDVSFRAENPLSLDAAARRWRCGPTAASLPVLPTWSSDGRWRNRAPRTRS